MEGSMFLFFSTLISCVLVGNSYPAIDLNKSDRIEDNSIILVGTAISYINSTAALLTFTSHRCVYIPPNLEPCNFTSYQESRENVQLKHKSSENKKDKFIYYNKKFSLQSPKGTFETGKSIKQEHTIIYEIQTCRPHRLPFDNIPSCTKEDLTNKKNEVQQLYPFVVKNSANLSVEFPVYNISR